MTQSNANEAFWGILRHSEAFTLPLLFQTASAPFFLSGTNALAYSDLAARTKKKKGFIALVRGFQIRIAD
jgi:hypothetical protein